jgi:DNA polymerase I-like protein with 3'-5' exonuclease and polymerase domains
MEAKPMATIIQNADLDERTLAAASQDTKDQIYNALDCCLTHEIHTALEAQQTPSSRKTYALSLALRAPVLEMNLRGILVDTNTRDKALVSIRGKISKVNTILKRVCEAFGFENFNYNSPAQCKLLFYGVQYLDLKPIRKRNAHGVMAPTTNRDALERLSSYYYAEFFCNAILTLRNLDKKRQFFETEIDKDNRFRCSYNIAGTNTGRMSSSFSDFGTGKNMQNIDREERDCFVADKGMKFCNIDLEQGDSRNVGAICWQLFYESHGPEFAGAYLDACESGDLHTTVAKMTWNELDWPEDMSDLAQARLVAEQLFYRQDSYRQMAKKLGHGTNYLGTPNTMAMHTKTPVSIIKEFQERYFGAFPCIPAWHQLRKKQLEETFQIETLMGRNRMFWGRATDPNVLRPAIAYEPQSLTSDEINEGMLQLWRAGKPIQLLCQVHDSILFQYPEELEEVIIPWALATLPVKIPLVGGRQFSVPADAKIGWNWGEVEYNLDGTPRGNPDGLIKWKGQLDKRKRLTIPNKKKKLRLEDYL